METFVRGKSAEAIQDASAKVDRALRAGAVATGGRVRINTAPGYLPLCNDPGLAAIFKENMLTMIPADQFVEGGHFSASTDMGDITHVMPGLQPMIGGARGAFHGREFLVVDPISSYVNSAKALAMTVVDLLADGAAEAERVLASFKPRLTRQGYLDLLRSVAFAEDFDGASVGRRQDLSSTP